MENKRYIEAGQIVNTHGTRGEVKIRPWVDSAEFLETFKTLYLGDRPYEVRESSVHKGCLLASLSGVEDVNAAMALKGRTVFIDRQDAALPPGGCFIADIIGARVLDEDGGEVGVLAEVFESPASMIYVVRGQSEHLIPAVPEFIRAVDVENGVITVHLIEGM